MMAALVFVPSDVFWELLLQGRLSVTGGHFGKDYSYTLLMLATLPNKTRNKKLHSTLPTALTKVTPARLQHNKLTSD